MRNESVPDPPTMKFLCFTNDAGETEALFRVDHPPWGLVGAGISELSYQSPTGWARSSHPQAFGLHFEGTSSIATVSVETTNVAARVVVNLRTRRKYFSGLYDLFRFRLATLQHKHFRMNADVTLLTNQTSAVSP